MVIWVIWGYLGQIKKPWYFLIRYYNVTLFQKIIINFNEYNCLRNIGKEESIPMLNVNHNKDFQEKVRRQSSGVMPGALSVPISTQSYKTSDKAAKTPTSLVPSSMPASARTSLVSELTNMADMKHNYGN